MFLITFFYSCEKSNEADYTVSPDDMFTITMVSNVSTGYSWYWEDKGCKGVVDSLKRDYDYIDSEGIGKEGKENWTFIAKKKGGRKISFCL